MNGKTLVAYFSKSGNTRKAAEAVARESGGNLYEIQIERDYPKSYFMTVILGMKEFFRKERSRIKSESVAEFDSYENILLGFPIWYGTCPMAVISFLEKYNFTGKNVYIFFTSGGARDCSKAKSDIAKVCPAAKIHDGIRLNSNEIQVDRIKSWLEK